MTLDVDIRAQVGSFSLEAALTAHPGEVLAVLGPNGSGKSTLLSAIAGHLPADGGRIDLAGRMLDGPRPGGDRRRRTWLPPERRRVALLGQRALLLPHLTVVENVAFGLRAQGSRRSAAHATATAWLDEVDMGAYARRRPSELSGGQQQRVALARALASAPEALLLDEPFASLDAQTASQARALIARQRDRAGVPIVLVTHDAMDAVVLAARTLVLREGRVVQHGTTAEVLGHPGSEFVAAMAGVNLLVGTADADGTLRSTEGADARWRGHGDTLAPGEPGTCVFAPGSVRLHPRDQGSADEPPAAASGVNRWSGTVSTMDPVPGGVRLFTAEHPGIAVDCPSTSALNLGIRPGTMLTLTVAVDDVSVRRTR